MKFHILFYAARNILAEGTLAIKPWALIGLYNSQLLTSLWYIAEPTMSTTLIQNLAT